MRLQKRIEEQAAAISAAMVGNAQRVLVEGPRRKRQTSWPAAPTTTASVNPVGVPAAARLIHTFVDVRITSALPHLLRGEIRDPWLKRRHAPGGGRWSCCFAGRQQSTRQPVRGARAR